MPMLDWLIETHSDWIVPALVGLLIGYLIGRLGNTMRRLHSALDKTNKALDTARDLRLQSERAFYQAIKSGPAPAAEDKPEPPK
jgi:hypothetical protein